PITLGTGDERDTTGGFRNEEGHLTLYLPLDMPDLPLRGIGPETLTLPARTSSTPPPHQREGAYWLRCQYVQDPDKPEVRYTETPVIRRVRAEVLGSTVRATNAVFVTDEEVGVSSGDPGQTFKLKQERILDLIGDEQVQVEERHNGELTFKEWQRVHTFCESERHDRHYMLDTDRGEIIFGPAIRQVDGTVRQYGCVPGVGRHVRITQYRYSGGAQGNVPKGKITTMHATQPYIDRAVNRHDVHNGRDQETLEEAIMRAQRAMRYQQRMVTGEDFEQLALTFVCDQNGKNFSVARTHCIAADADSPGRYLLLVVPRHTVAPPDQPRVALPQFTTPEQKAAYEEEQRQWAFDQLAVDNEFKARMRTYLDRHRLL
ncbi:MAG: hypothetical protein KDE46_29640, partial [Caldilineaceae bacterium]|nr:hypothetical protein [Caldilineaceae bacterium]